MGCRALLQGTFSNPEMEPASPASPALAGGFFTTSATWEALSEVWTLVYFSYLLISSSFPFSLCIWFPFQLFRHHFLKNNLFIFGCAGSSLLCWLSLVAASVGYSLVAVCSFSLRWLLLLQSVGSRAQVFLGSRAQAQ